VRATLPFLFACGNLCAQTPLRIAAAADLQPVLPPVLAAFQKSTGIKATVSYASSATLSTQILNGAPLDLFLAADTSFPQRIITAGLAEESAPAVYARGSLVLWARTDTLAQLHRPLTLALLTDATLARIAVANPKHAPYGRAAMAALYGLGIYAAVQSKLVYAENIAQAAQYAVSGNAQAGLLSRTQAETPALRSLGRYISIPQTVYPPIAQGAVIVKNSPQHVAAEAFLRWLLAPQGQQLLQQGGLDAASPQP
jgi:molybdate transport system substrate-binding protein